MSAIELDLNKVTGVKRGRMTRDEYLRALVKAASDLPDNKWGMLKEESQNWATSNIRAIKAKKDLADFPDAEDAADDQRSNQRSESRRDDDEQQEQDVAKKKGGAGGGAAKSASAKTSKANGNGKGGGDKPATKTVKASGKGDGPSAPTLIKTMCLKNPEITTKDINKKLTERGFKLSDLTVSSIRSAFRHSVRILDEAGALKRKVEV